MQTGSSMAKIRGGELIGLIFGFVVFGVMIFMMFVILGGLLNGEQ